MHLLRTKDLSRYTIAATDADIGSIHDFYFDDEHWTIRYIVVGTGVLLSGRKVLISPVALHRPPWMPLHLRVNLTWAQIENSPSVDVHKPVSRQHEKEHSQHYGWPQYWEGTAGSGLNPRPGPAAAPRPEKLPNPAENASGDTHLRSTSEVTGYRIHATDGEIGHLEDFLFDDESWKIRYAIVDTKNWWPGKKILLRPQWIDRVSWTDHEIYVRMSREAIQKAPAWEADKPVSREYELRLHRHYGYAPYWTEDE
ncbi:MAG: PRC-barrel domain-containing protein [Acidobacteriaceae bacterium]